MSVSPPEYMGCPWPVDPACFSDEWEAMDTQVKERAVALASDVLHRLSGRRVTNCPLTVRPNSGWNNQCFIPGIAYNPWGIGAFTPGMNVDGRWVNNCGPTCSNPSTSVRLPRPVGRVDEVWVDGVVLPVTDYRVMDGNMLVYTGTGDGWPVNQDLSLPLTEVGTFGVVYINGYPPDMLAATAAGTMAMEFAKACTGKNCKLPQGVTSIVRQGVSMNITTGLFPDGKTGIREVDAFIALWNPRNQKQPTTVWSPGTGVSW